MNHKNQIILLALEELKNASYSVERREECEELIREIRNDEPQGDLLLWLPRKDDVQAD